MSILIYDGSWLELPRSHHRNYAFLLCSSTGHASFSRVAPRSSFYWREIIHRDIWVIRKYIEGNVRKNLRPRLLLPPQHEKKRTYLRNLATSQFMTSLTQESWRKCAEGDCLPHLRDSGSFSSFVIVYEYELISSKKNPSHILQ
jgi:hypothetical protein